MLRHSAVDAATLGRGLEAPYDVTLSEAGSPGETESHRGYQAP